MRRNAWLPSVIASTPIAEELIGEARRDPDAVRRVLAVHDARVDLELRADRAAGAASSARLPGAPTTSAMKRMRRAARRLTATPSVADGKTWIDDVVAAVGRVPLERLALEAADVVTVPSFDDPAATFAPTVSAGSGRTFWIETTSDGADDGRSSISDADLAPRDDLVADRDDGPVDRRVDVGSGDGADVERAQRAARELVPREAAPRRARDPAPEPCEQPLVRLRADGLEDERAVLAPVEADRRDAALRDG